jgi:hypothetical protein
MADGRSLAGRLRRRAAAVALLTLIASAAPGVRADEHDPEVAGHPLRMIAYALHPVGVAIDYLILRPAHWVVNREPFRTIFGHED